MTDESHQEKRALTGLTVDELAALLGSRARALAAARWIYETVRLPDRLPDSVPGVGREAWRRLVDACEIGLPRVATRVAAPDGSLKYAMDSRGARFETVLLPTEGRTTVCISSQAGCTRRCAFCATARLGFERNLTAAEMVGQFLVARPEAPAPAPLRNVVFMGMGEPLDNLDEVLRAVKVFTQRPAPQLAAGHVTVSTSGILPGMRRFLEECPAHLALSLNGTTDEQRGRLMPHNRLWPLGDLMAELRRDASRRPRRACFVEYVLLDGVNDSDDDARRLLGLLDGARARVNLIGFNPVPGLAWRASGPERMRAFQSIVLRGGVRCLLRASRGGLIAAACGQLALEGA